ncbi:hypothetical protein ACFL9T_08065 [Thermodesulfobacteriota bacterium]
MKENNASYGSSGFQPGRIITIIAVSFLLWGSASGQTIEKAFAATQESKDIDFFSQEKVTEKIEELKTRIKISKQAANEQKAQQIGTTLAELNERTSKLRDIMSSYERLLTALKKSSSLKKEKAFLQDKMKTQEHAGITKKPPYNLSFYNRMMDEIAISEQQKKTIDIALKLAKRALENATLRVEGVRKEWRNITELHEKDAKGEKRQHLAWDLAKAEREKELSEALVKLEKLKIENLSDELEISKIKTLRARQDIDWVRTRLRFDKGELQKQLDIIASKRIELEKLVKRLMGRQEKAEQSWQSAKKSVDAHPREKMDPIQEAYLKEREAAHSVYLALLEQTEEKLRVLDFQANIWRLRYKLFNEDIKQDELQARREEIENHIKNVYQLLNMQQRTQSNTLSQIIALERGSYQEKVSTPQ